MDLLTNIENNIRVWSLDGGGRSVLAQLVIIDKLMHLIQSKKRLDHIPNPCEYADIIIGTGLGGAAAILLGRLRRSASEAYHDLVELGQCVFMKPNESATKPLFSLDTLRSAVQRMLERHGYKPDTMMIENTSLPKRAHTIVLASSQVDATGYKCLRTYPSPTGTNSTIADAIVAAIAAPDWFDAVPVGSGHEKQNLVNVSIGHSNPTWEGLLEAKQFFGVDARVTSVISIGCGMTFYPATTDDKTNWVEQVINDCEKIARRLSGYLASVPAYVRLKADSVLDDTNISNWEEDATDLVKVQTISYLDKVETRKLLDKTVENLLQETGSVSLGQLTQATAPKVGARSVPRITPYYVPRPEMHEDMQRYLNEEDTGSQKMLVMHGMAGSGKTQLASFFAHTYRERYQHVFFIDTSSVTSVKADLKSAIRSLGGVHSQDSYEDAIAYLKSSESGKYLVIFDNADDPNLPLIDFIPLCDHGHIIITTRNPDLALLAPTSHLGIKQMDEANALRVLSLASQSSSPDSQLHHEHAVEICKLVGCLPLALVQVGCYCYSSKISFVQYLDRFKEHRQRLMVLRPNWQIDQYPHSAYTSISLSYSLLEDRDKSLLHLLALFHHSSIQVDILRFSTSSQFTIDPDFDLATRGEYHSQRRKELQDLFTENEKWNQPRVDELLMRLQSLSLLTLGSDNDTLFISIHPLVQSFAQDILTREDFHRFHYMATLTLSGCVWDDNPDVLRYLFLHIYEVESHNAQIHLNDLAAFAYFFFIMSFEKEALQRWQLVENRCQEQFGPDNPSTLYASAQAATCLRELGEYQSAETILRRIIPFQERILGVDHPNTLSSYDRYAFTLEEQEKYREAETLLRTRFQIAARKHGRAHEETADALSSLGTNLFLQGRYSEAEDMLREAIEELKRKIPEEGLLVLTSTSTLARTLIKLGKWEEAEVILEKLVQTRTRIFGMHDVQTLVSIGSLSRCIRHRGDLIEAERIQRSCLDLLSKRFSSDNKNVVAARQNLEETLQLLSRGYKDGGREEGTSRLGRSAIYYVTLSCLAALIAVLVVYLT